MEREKRTELLELDDKSLSQHCRTDRLRGSGRGGQKRNVTESAIRVVHDDSGIFAFSDATRIQQQNRKIALKLLRFELALGLRCSPPQTFCWKQRPNEKNDRYPLWVADVMDILHAAEFRVGDAAKVMGLSTNRLNKELQKDSRLWQAVNHCREKAGLSALKVR